MIEDNLSDRGLFFELELSENILSENEFSEKKGLSEKKDRLISVLKGKSVDRPPL